METAWRAPARISRNGCNSAGRGGPKRRSHASGPKPHDAGKASFQVAKFHGAHQRGEVSAERAQGGAIFRARIERRDQEDRGAGERRGYWLREGRRSACRFG